MKLWERRTESEVRGITINVEDGRSITGKESREMTKGQEASSKSREDGIKVCLDVKLNDSTGRGI